MKFKLFLPAILIALITLAGFSTLLPKADASPDIIFSDAATDGFVGYDSYTPEWWFLADIAYLHVGDDSQNRTYRSFVKFDISGISGALFSARLYLYLDFTYYDDAGYVDDPLTNPGLGDLNIIHIDDYGDLDAGAYSQPSVGNDPGTLIASGATPYKGYVSIDVTAAMEDDLFEDETYTAFMIRCAVDTDDDDQADSYTFLSADTTGTDKDPYIEYDLAPTVTLEIGGEVIYPLTINVCSDFELEIWIRDIPEGWDMIGFDFYVEWDPNLMEYQYHTTNNHGWSHSHGYSVDGGYLWFDYPSDTSHTIAVDDYWATIVFHCIGEGVSTITVTSLDTIYLWDGDPTIGVDPDIFELTCYQQAAPSRRVVRSVLVGGVFTSANKLMILAPYLTLIGLVAAVTTAAIIVKRRRKA